MIDADGRFTCALYGVRMLATGCVMRQERHQIKRWGYGGRQVPLDPNCEHCQQGREIAALVAAEAAKPKKRGRPKGKSTFKPKPAPPRAGKREEKTVSKPTKEQLMDRDHLPEGYLWCSRCGDEKGAQPKKNFSRDKTMASGFARYCKTCKNAAQREQRARRNLIRETTAVSKGSYLAVDFSAHPEILERIEKTAQDELRTPENQVLYWLRENLAADRRSS